MIMRIYEVKESGSKSCRGICQAAEKTQEHNGLNSFYLVKLTRKYSILLNLQHSCHRRFLVQKHIHLMSSIFHQLQYQILLYIDYNKIKVCLLLQDFNFMKWCFNMTFCCLFGCLMKPSNQYQYSSILAYQHFGILAFQHFSILAFCHFDMLACQHFIKQCSILSNTQYVSNAI